MGRAEGHRGVCSIYNTDLRENVLVSYSAVYSANVKEEMFKVKIKLYFYFPKQRHKVAKVPDGRKGATFAHCGEELFLRKTESLQL